MILDAIIGLFGALLECVFAAVVPLINVAAAGIEAVVGIFVPAFRLRRIERKMKGGEARGAAGAILCKMLILLVVIGCIFLVPKWTHRTVTFVAKDGHSLPFAALIIHTNDGDQHKRTDAAGKVAIPRFGTIALTIKDARYIERTWKKAEITSELAVTRTALGAGLDSLADRLLRPAKE